jgi:hypothetical protein
MNQSIRALIILAVWTCLTAKTDKWCLSRSYDKRCDLCEYSYLDEKTNSCVADIPDPVDHCKRYKREDDVVSCVICDHGYRLDNKKCIACTDKCARCNKTQFCSYCLGGLVPDLHNEKCVENSGVGIDNCEILMSTNMGYTCLKCAQGFTKSSGNGSACFKGHKGCSLVDNENCIECHSGYFMDDNEVCRKRDSMTNSIQEEEPEGATRILGMRNKDLVVTVGAVVAVLALILILNFTICRKKHSPAQPEGVEIAL